MRDIIWDVRREIQREMQHQRRLQQRQQQHQHRQEQQQQRHEQQQQRQRQAQAANAEALFTEGLRFYSSGNYPAAFDRFRRAAELGHASAQYNLGWMYYEGRGVARDDRQAVQWFRRAAQQGHADAQNYLTDLGFDW